MKHGRAIHPKYRRWSIRESNPGPPTSIVGVVHRIGTIFIGIVRPRRFSPRVGWSYLRVAWPLHHHPPDDASPFTSRRDILASVYSFPRSTGPVPKAARARGAESLLTSVVFHMGFIRDPRAPGPALLRSSTTSKPFMPQDEGTRALRQGSRSDRIGDVELHDVLDGFQELGILRTRDLEEEIRSTFVVLFDQCLHLEAIEIGT